MRYVLLLLLTILHINTHYIVANVDTTHVDKPCFPKYLNIQYMAAMLTISTGQLQLPCRLSNTVHNTTADSLVENQLWPPLGMIISDHE